MQFDTAKIGEFCRRWRIIELSLFGSALRTDFRAESDIDILVSFEPDVPWSLLDWVEMKDELEAMFGREVDLVEKSGLRNPFRRDGILNNRQILYAI
ncbi:MAG: nucleotidyltransferase family protein [bacterium]